MARTRWLFTHTVRKSSALDIRDARPTLAVHTVAERPYCVSFDFLTASALISKEKRLETRMTSG